MLILISLFSLLNFIYTWFTFRCHEPTGIDGSGPLATASLGFSIAATAGLFVLAAAIAYLYVDRASLKRALAAERDRRKDSYESDFSAAAEQEMQTLKNSGSCAEDEKCQGPRK